MIATGAARKRSRRSRPANEATRALSLSAILYAVLYAVFSTLIVLSARGDLWLDEIWSLDFARASHSVADLFLRFRHDNNHPLNTLFMYAVRVNPVFLVDRILAILSGIGTLILIGETTRRDWGAWESVLSVILVGTSFPLLLYFSEARGYAPAVFFAVLAYVALLRNFSTPRMSRLVLFWLASALGVLSHSTFVIPTIALCVLHAGSVFQSARTTGGKLGQFLLHQVPALAFPVGWYFLFVRHMEIGGGPLERRSEVITGAAAYLLGLPARSPWSFLALGLVVLIIILGSRRLRLDGRTEWIFFPAMLLLAPALVLAVVRPKYLYFRYFILCFPFFYMLLAYMLGRVHAAWPRSARWLPILAVLVLLAGQSTRIYPLLRVGRGQYAAAWARIAKDSPGQDVYVGSDHDFRNRMVLRFYAARETLGKLLYYVPQSEWTRHPPQWVLVTEGQEFSEPPLEIPFKDVGSYRFVARYQAAPVSGWGWFLYRREGP
jgi:hypothetical protein